MLESAKAAHGGTYGVGAKGGGSSGAVSGGAVVSNWASCTLWPLLDHWTVRWQAELLAELQQLTNALLAALAMGTQSEAVPGTVPGTPVDDVWLQRCLRQLRALLGGARRCIGMCLGGSSRPPSQLVPLQVPCSPPFHLQYTVHLPFGGEGGAQCTIEHP